jgi:ABC-type branched-subunit amino acid transport system substrate-binding protein
VKASVGSPVTPSGKTRIALLLPLSGGAAPIGQAMQQAAEMALFDTGAKELALAAYDSGDSAETAMEAYRKARTDGVAMVLGPLFGASAKALAPLVAQGGANVVSFSNDETAAQRGVWIMGIAAPPQVRRVVDYSVEAGIKRFAAFAPQTSYGEQMVRALESQVAIRGGTVAGVELYAMARGAWYAAPDPARRADFERRFLATYGRPPNRLATLAYDGVALAGNLARLKPGGDFSAEAITNPSGWSGVDGIFRFLPDGRSERALAVIEVQGNRGTVVSPAPTTFVRPTN